MAMAMAASASSAFARRLPRAKDCPPERRPMSSCSDRSMRSWRGIRSGVCWNGRDLPASFECDCSPHGLNAGRRISRRRTTLLFPHLSTFAPLPRSASVTVNSEHTGATTTEEENPARPQTPSPKRFDLIGARNGTVTRVPRVLSVAGSDSGAGAGLQADIKTCMALGVFCTTAITAVTAQNTLGVQRVMTVPQEMVQAQLESILADIGADVIKTGMLPTAECVSAVADIVQQQRGRNSSSVPLLVVDPVLIATSGDILADPQTVIPAFRELLLPLADVVTPNIPEASALLGGTSAEGGAVTSIDDMKATAMAIHRMGPRCVVVKGGHGCSSGDVVVDVVYDGQHMHELVKPRVVTRNTHGTGCSLASAIAAQLAKGLDTLPAIQVAQDYLWTILNRSSSISIGRGGQGPMDHLLPSPPRPSSSSSSTSSSSSPFSLTVRDKFRPCDLRLYAVTDPRFNARWQRNIEQAVEEAILGGATFLQIREKDADTSEFVKEAMAAVKIAQAYGVPLVINDRVDVALACDADGVHVGQTDMPVSFARALLGPTKIVGASAKTVEQVRTAWQDGADYVGVGGVFPTQTKSNNRTIGVKGLEDICRESPIPVVAIGGISAMNVGEIFLEVREEALAGVAVVSALFDREDIRAATADLRARVDQLLLNA